MVYAVHRTDGYVLWKKQLGGAIEGSLAYGRSKIVVGDSQGHLYGLNARDGSEAWQFKIQSEWLAPATFLRDKIFVMSASDDLYALSENQGKELWHYSHRGDEKMTIRGTGSPMVFGNEVFQGFSDGNLVALTVGNGRVLWTKKLRSKDRFYDIDMIPYVDEQRVIAGTYDGKVYSLDRLTGNTQWIFPAGSYGGFLAEESRIYFSGLNGTFYALDKTTGTVIWKTPFDKGVGMTPVRAGDYLVLTTSGDPVYVIDPTDGKIQWTGKLGTGSMAGAAGSSDGWFYCLSNYGNLYSFAIIKNVHPKKGPAETLPVPSALRRKLVELPRNNGAS
jgi:outer membrane protein assembly factor BamB